MSRDLRKWLEPNQRCVFKLFLPGPRQKNPQTGNHWERSWIFCLQRVSKGVDERLGLGRKTTLSAQQHTFSHHQVCPENTGKQTSSSAGAAASVTLTACCRPGRQRTFCTHGLGEESLLRDQELWSRQPPPNRTNLWEHAVFIDLLSKLVCWFWWVFF